MWRKSSTQKTNFMTVATSSSSMSPSAANSQLNGNLTIHEIVSNNNSNNLTGDEGAKKKLIVDDEVYHNIVMLEMECHRARDKILLEPIMSPNVSTIEQKLWELFIKQYKIHLVCLQFYFFNILLCFICFFRMHT